MNGLIRGDYLPFRFKLEYEDGTIKPEIVDEAIFWLKENIYSKQPLIEKKLSTNDIYFNSSTYWYYFNFSSNETKDFNYDKKYPFAIKIFLDGKPYTVAKGFLSFTWEGVFVYED